MTPTQPQSQSEKRSKKPSEFSWPSSIVGYDKNPSFVPSWIRRSGEERNSSGFSRAEGIVRRSHSGVILITAPVSLGHQTATMANRTLKDMTYTEGLPASGRCSECGRLFSALPDDTENTERVTRDFYTTFAAHECTDESSKITS